jgi:hypothetical protein
MTDHTTQASHLEQWENKAKAADSAERKEDYMVLVLAGVTVALVMSGVIGPSFFKSLFF